MVEIIRPAQSQPVVHLNALEVENRLIYVALRKHLGDRCTAEYVKQLKDNEELQKRTIEGKTYYVLKDKVILWIQFPPRPVNGSPNQTVGKLSYQFY